MNKIVDHNKIDPENKDIIFEENQFLNSDEDLQNFLTLSDFIEINETSTFNRASILEWLTKEFS